MADLFIGPRENSDGTATFNASIRSVLRGSASLEGCQGFCQSVLIGGPKVYHPEAYYMRGPGPRWREKHAQGRDIAV